MALEGGEQLGVPDRPEPVVALGPVDELPVRSLGQHLVHQRAHPCRAAVHQQDRGRVQLHLGHPGRELDGLGVMDPLVGQHDPVVRVRGPPGDVERPDQAAHGQSAGGVLVQVHGRVDVPDDVAVPLPATQPRGDLAVGPGEGAGRGGIADAVRRQGESPERCEAERPRCGGHEGRGTRGAGLHQIIVGCRPSDLMGRCDGARSPARTPRRGLRPGDVRPGRRGLHRRPRGDRRPGPPGPGTGHRGAPRVRHQQRLPTARRGGREAGRTGGRGVDRATW